MSLFYRSLGRKTGTEFQERKQKFKQNKPCAICGRILSSEQMMVAHLVPVREIQTKRALFDQSNWQVRCIECERRLHREEQLRENIRPWSEEWQQKHYKIEAIREARTRHINFCEKHRNFQRARVELVANRLNCQATRTHKGAQVANDLTNKKARLSPKAVRDVTVMSNVLTKLQPRKRSRRNRKRKNDYYENY